MLLSALLALVSAPASVAFLSQPPGTACPGAAASIQQPTQDRRDEDAEIEAYQEQLLDLAFSAASAFPEVPHLKNRCRLQEEIIAALLELDQPNKAHSLAAHITNWRKGAAYADVAFHRASSGATADVDRLLQLAATVAETILEEEESGESWRSDRIVMKVARVHAVMGRGDLAAAMEARLPEAERGKVTTVLFAQASEGSLDDRLRELTSTVASGSMDLVRNALDSFVEVYDDVFDDEELRGQIEKLLADASGRTPLQVVIENRLKLADVAIRHGDNEKALELTDLVESLYESAKWRPRDDIPVRARIAQRRFAAGEESRGRGDLDAALADFEAQRARIYDVFRSETLQPVAEALVVMGDRLAAHSIYRAMAEEGSLNPNSRPRAEDLVALCCSMATHGLQPDAKLWKRLNEIRDGLSEPW